MENELKEYKIAIPTYRRSDVIKDYAFKWLKAYGIDFNRVYLFVSDEIDYEEYGKKYSDMNIVLSNTKNIGENRNFIRNYFEEGQYVVSLDDSFPGLSQSRMSSESRLFESRKAHKWVSENFSDYCKWEEGATKLKYLSK